MATSKKAVTVYLDNEVLDYVEKYCTEYGVMGKDKGGNTIPRLGTGIHDLLKQLLNTPIDELTKPLKKHNDSTVINPLDSNVLSEINERLTKLESIVYYQDNSSNGLNEIVNDSKDIVMDLNDIVMDSVDTGKVNDSKDIVMDLKDIVVDSVDNIQDTPENNPELALESGIKENIPNEETRAKIERLINELAIDMGEVENQTSLTELCRQLLGKKALKESNLSRIINKKKGFIAPPELWEYFSTVKKGKWIWTRIK